jgi:two-component system, chemotaxis family, sensor kinase CheA
MRGQVRGRPSGGNHPNGQFAALIFDSNGGGSVDVSEYLGLFLDESRENLQQLNASLLDMERDPSHREPLTAVFRVAHSLKGMSATMGFAAMAGLTHRMEEVLAGLRDGGHPITPAVTDALFACLDTLQEMVDRVADGDSSDLDTGDLLARLEAVAGQAEDAPAAPPAVAAGATMSDYERMVVAQAAQQGLRVIEAAVELEAGCVLRAARVYMIAAELEALGDIVRSEPTTEQIERDEIGDRLVFWLATAAGPDDVAAAVRRVSEVASCVTVPVETGGDSGSGGAAGACAAGTSAPPAERVGEGAPKSPPRSAASTVRVGTDRLDALMNLMGEMVIVRTRLAQLAASGDTDATRAAVEDLTRVTGDLQTLVMRVRMMPVEAVFMRFPRMVRDLAQALGKQVNLEVVGEDTELDRTLIDELGDPLVHMLRNAVDHGLEGPEERAAAGKDPTGTVVLEARHAGSSVVIEVRDDGRGMDPDALRASALRKGLIDAARAESMSDAEALELVLMPGFSTAETTTDISGRGVGMDAVRAGILSLGGSVEITSVPGRGTTFAVRLPLTLAIIGALLVRAADEVYAVPIEAIEEIVELPSSEVQSAGARPCMVLRDTIVPMIWLGERLHVDGDRGDRDRLDVVVVNTSSGRVGVVVDGLIGQQDIVIKKLPVYLGEVLGVAGATILGDGSVALIIDIGALGPAAGR